jgi:RNA polymerase sigma factor (TIGR02999 family)
MPDPGVTELLLDWSRGKRDALDRLLPLVQTSLHEIARAHLRRERPDHSLEPSALVNELYLKLIDQRQVSWRDRTHFFGVAARMMRHILVDHARRKQSEKRGGDLTRITLSESLGTPENDRLELRFFAGLTIEETAEALSISPATVKREWTMAKAWLRRAVTERAVLRGAS